MEISHPIADGTARPGWTRSRGVRLLALVLLTAATVAGFGARSALAADPVTITFSVSPTAVPLGGAVTMTATVTSPLGAPDGFISFVSIAPATAYDSHQQLLNPTSDPNTTSFTFSPTDLGPGNYVIRALYTPTILASSLLGVGATYSATSQALAVGMDTTPLRPTQVILSAPATVDSTTPVTLTATVSEVPAGGIPTGAVQFVDMISGSPIELRPSSVALVNGVAQLVVPSFDVGPHKILATYTGGGGFAPSSSQPPWLINSIAPVDSRVTTFTDVVISPSPTASGATTTIRATIVQETPAGLIPATGGTVDFTAKKQGDYSVKLGSAALGSAPAGQTAAPNQAVIQNSSLAPGTYTILASYAGNLYGFRDSAKEVPLTVLPPRPATDITYTGDTTVAFGHAATLSATIVAHGGGALVGRLVTFTLGLASCQATVAANGFASCSVVAAPATAPTSVTITVPEDIQTAPATLTVPFTVSRTETLLSYNGPASAPYNGTSTLSATLTGAAGVAVPGRIVTFTLGTQSCSGTTNAAGFAACAIAPIALNAGPTTVNVGYSGDAYTDSATAAAPFAVTPVRTTLVAAAPVTAGSTLTLAATLTETLTGAPLVGKTVTLSLGTAATTCTATTIAAGLATCPVPMPSGSSATLTATFAGDVNYIGSSDAKTGTLLKPTTVTYTGATSGDYHDVVVLSGTLAAQGVPLSGRTLTFTLGSQSCTATTSSAGTAWCLLLLNQPAGATTVTVSSAPDATYAGVVASQAFGITREETALVAKVSEAVLNGSSIALSALLLEDRVLPVANRTVTLKLGTASCSATTNALGSATCSVPRAPSVGPSTFTATFAGDAYYLPSSATRSTVVCSFPSGGSFVIGDRDDDSVNFWGSQWSKKNHLSHGDAPSSFKGWAPGNFDQSWNGDGWSSATGSSGSQPATTLPAYMAVIQAGSSRKSGSTVYGDTAHIVVVKVDAGYAPNAGHDGTGTVVATVR